jgi:hypothetical protein
MSINRAYGSQPGLQTRDRPDGVILLGQCFAFILKEPQGWKLDSSAGKSDGVDAVIYRDGQSWRDGTAVMYVRVIYKNRHKKTIEDVIRGDANEFKAANSNSTVSVMPSLTTRDKKEAMLRHFYDAQNKNEEAVAYIDEPCVVVIIVLTSRTKQEYSESLRAFHDLTASYFFVHELVDTKF